MVFQKSLLRFYLFRLSTSRSYFPNAAFVLSEEPPGKITLSTDEVSPWLALAFNLTYDRHAIEALFDAPSKSRALSLSSLSRTIHFIRQQF